MRPRPPTALRVRRAAASRSRARALGLLVGAALAAGGLALVGPGCSLDVGGVGAGPTSGEGGLDGPLEGGAEASGGDDGGQDGDAADDADCPRVCSGNGGEVLDCHGGHVASCDAGTCVSGSCVAAAWTPKSLPGLVLWLRADSIVADAGASVGTWADHSGQGHDVTQTVDGVQPTLHSGWKNGQPAVAFSGTQFLSNTSTSLVPGNSAYSVLVVGQSSGPPQGALVSIRTAGAASCSIWYVLGTTTYVHNGTAATGIVAQDLSTTLDAPFTSVHRYTGSGGTPSAFLNGTALTVSGSQGDESGGTTGFEVGTNLASQAWKGDIAEIVVVSDAIADGDRAQWDTYVKSRYAIP